MCKILVPTAKVKVKNRGQSSDKNMKYVIFAYYARSRSLKMIVNVTKNDKI
jgi:hypothetical protein